MVVESDLDGKRKKLPNLVFYQRNMGKGGHCGSINTSSKERKSTQREEKKQKKSPAARTADRESSAQKGGQR